LRPLPDESPPGRSAESIEREWEEVERDRCIGFRDEDD